MRHYITTFELGQYGSNNDSGFHANSKMRKMFDNDELYVPADCISSELHGQVLEMKFFFEEMVSLTLEKMQVRKSKSITGTRRCVENAFGILSAHWRIFHKQKRVTIENMEKCTVTYLALHNHLRLRGNAHYILSCFVDLEDKYNNLLPRD